VFSGEVDQLLVPSSYRTARYPCIFVHGAEGGPGALDWMTASPYRWPPIRTCIDICGCIGLSADLGGNATWGNATAQSRLDAAFTYLQTIAGVKLGKVVLFAQSMGAINALVWAKNNKAKVAAIVGTIPVTNLTFAWQHGAYTAAINAAYGGAYSEATYGAARNPTTFAASLAGIPGQLWVGNTDPLARPVDAVAISSAAPSITTISIPGGHDEATIGAIDLAVVASFIDQHSV
jgi:pimeloyl-ACP methyl ester carboxylesterase